MLSALLESDVPGSIHSLKDGLPKRLLKAVEYLGSCCAGL